jgi:hypothetical protein
VSLQATQVAGPFESREVDYKNSARDAAAAYWCGFVFFAYAIRQDSYGQQISTLAALLFSRRPGLPARSSIALEHKRGWKLNRNIFVGSTEGHFPVRGCGYVS